MTEPNKPLDQMTAQERLDLGRSYYNEGKFDEAIKTWSNIRREEADSKTYAQAQLGLGAAYYAQNKIDQAIKTWSNIRREKAAPETYAKAQRNLGVVYHTLGKLDEAIDVWSKVRNDDPESYAWAQFGLGVAYKDQGKLKQAIDAWSNVPQDDRKAYAWAQKNLGLAYAESGKREQAIKTWSNIHREEADPETYAQAQFNLGLAYKARGNLDDAITAWSNIRREDDPETYADAQLNLGNAYKARGNLDEAITAWKKVREDNPETYADAQFNLGHAYKKQGDLEQTIKTWSNISHDDNPETYAKAQLNLGAAYYAQGNLDEAITAWKKVREDNPETYAKAQLNLGAAYYAQRKLDQAIKICSNIRREEADPETYAQAQFNLGLAYAESGKREQAIKTWSNIRREEADPETYARAQFNIGKIYEDKGDLERAKEAYCNAQDFFYYNYERVKRILECPPKVIKKLRGIAENTDEVLKSLQIIPEFELKVAHYTRPQIAFDLFGDEKNDKKPSNFRLSTIRGVNDPTEGLVLNDYWDQQGIPETIHTNDTATFISCFTFNHDNLNQFRLYGKENGREATGVSLVFKKEFFSDQPDTLGFIAGPSTDLSSKSEQNKSNETGKTEGDNKKQLIGKSTLYRCIYLDPETGYWTLAQCNKSTFYREHNEYADAKEKWGKYYESISKKEECVEKYLFGEKDNKNKSISQILNSIFTEDHLYNKCNKDEKQKILEAIRFILLPLQYLVKHIAFQEEQECRIMYITQFRDEKIHSNREEQKMYVEYEESVLPHIDKIWLSPGAAKYQDFFRIRLDQGSGKSKVRLSQNPFRNKE